jgi:glycosyltransferase involved in cell wall biosynthesis
MKIAFFTHSLNVGGVENMVTQYLLELNRRHEVFLIELEYTDSFLYDQLKAAGIKVYDLLPNIKGLFGRAVRWLIYKYFYPWRLNSIIKKEKPDIFHVHTSARMCDKIKIPINRLFYSFHTDVERNLNFLSAAHKHNMEKLSAQGMHLIVLSQAMKADAQRLLPGCVVDVVPNGIDLDSIRSNKCDRSELLKSLDIPENAFIVGHVGRYHPVKNHERLLEIFAEVLKRRSDAFLLLVGAFTAEGSEKVNSKMEQLGIADHVRMLGLRSDATAIVSAFDAFVLPSLVEGFSLTLAEAQAQNVRCIASDVVPSEVICNKNCFTLSLDESNETWAELILSDSQRSEAQDLNQLSVHTAAGKLEKLYESAIKDTK